MFFQNYRTRGHTTDSCKLKEWKYKEKISLPRAINKAKGEFWKTSESQCEVVTNSSKGENLKVILKVQDGPLGEGIQQILVK